MSSPQFSSQAAQAGLAIAMAPDVDAAFQQLDVTDLRQSLPRLKLLIAAITARFGPASATLAARTYKADRAAAGFATGYTVKPASVPKLPQIGKTVDWATQPLWSAQPDVEQARANLTAATERLVLDMGRQTIVDNAAKDPKARGWARIPEPGACSFCALLAIRGAVYTGETGDFKSHDHCRCHVQPIFGKYEPSAQIRQWEADYYTATKGVRGMRNLQLAWRQAYEGRTPSK